MSTQVLSTVLDYVEALEPPSADEIAYYVLSSLNLPHAECSTESQMLEQPLIFRGFEIFHAQWQGGSDL